MNSVAYQKRNLPALLSRKAVFVLLMVYKLLASFLAGLNKPRKKNETQPLRILVYPRLTDRAQLSDVLNRLSWGLGSMSDVEVTLVVTRELSTADLNSLAAPACQHDFLKSRVFRIRRVVKNPGYFHDVLFVRDAGRLFSPFLLARMGKTEIIDPLFYGTCESNVWNKFTFNRNALKERKIFRQRSLANFRRFLRENSRKNEAYCFVTGPSFDTYKDYKFNSNALMVVCNSIVKHDSFLNYIKKPHILTFADPVFHFSPSLYAAKFRENMMEVWRRYRCFIAVPEKSAPLLLNHFPELKDWLIGIPVGHLWNIPTARRFRVKGTANILTLLMLPLASAVAKKIFVFGADGRDNKERYFWKHSSSVQYAGLMETAFQTHPSFFRDRSYAGYYKSHCRKLETLLQRGERRGRFYSSITPSFIPALKKRYKNLLQER